MPPNLIDKDSFRIYSKVEELVKVDLSLVGNWYFCSSFNRNILVGRYGEYEIVDFCDNYGLHYTMGLEGYILMVKIEGFDDSKLFISRFLTPHKNFIKVYTIPKFKTIR